LLLLLLLLLLHACNNRNRIAELATGHRTHNHNLGQPLLLARRNSSVAAGISAALLQNDRTHAVTSFHSSCVAAATATATATAAALLLMESKSTNATALMMAISLFMTPFTLAPLLLLLLLLPLLLLLLLLVDAKGTPQLILST
jgi:hypothetical protein